MDGGRAGSVAALTWVADIAVVVFAVAVAVFFAVRVPTAAGIGLAVLLVLASVARVASRRYWRARSRAQRRVG